MCPSVRGATSWPTESKATEVGPRLPRIQYFGPREPQQWQAGRAQAKKQIWGGRPKTAPKASLNAHVGDFIRVLGPV